MMRVQSSAIDLCVSDAHVRAQINCVCWCWLVVMDLAVVNNDGDHIHFQPDVVD